MNKFIIKNEDEENGVTDEYEVNQVYDNNESIEDTETANNIENTLNGLNLLCDTKKKKNMGIRTNINNLDIDLKTFDLNVDDFKLFFEKKIANFDIIHKKDIYDNLILSAYYHFIFSKINQDKLISFVKENSIN